MSHPENQQIANRFQELAALLEDQQANPFRVRAYQQAAAYLRGMNRPVSEVLAEGGVEALEALPSIGESIARAIASILTYGRLPMLERLRGEVDPASVLATVPGIGRALAERIHHELHIETLEDLEIAANDGRLETVPGFGPRRIAAVRDVLAARLRRVPTPRSSRPDDTPPVAELLEVDREYRDRAQRGELRTVAPRRFNPERRAWLPILHTHRGERHYTALYSNTLRAHQANRTRDWVVLYFDSGRGERQCTVITSEFGPLAGRRIVRGREAECTEFYRRWDEEQTAARRAQAADRRSSTG